MTELITPGVEMWTTGGGKRLHIAACPHLAGKDDVRRATDAEAAARSLCVICEKEVTGHGRIYCSSLEEAFTTFGLAAGYRNRVRSVASTTEHDSIWVVSSGSYIALGLRGQTVLGVNKTYLWFRGGLLEPFPGFQGGSGGGSSRPEERVGELCGTCFTSKPLSGLCDSCD